MTHHAGRPSVHSTSHLISEIWSQQRTIGGLVAETAVVESGAFVEIGAIVAPGTTVSKGIRVKSEKILDIQDIE
ncbi:hypothetical protein [Mesorhizobium sp.]|uniref:hypothetical protein n=1 Tax=Mesorhizobium sp. TaxID=1871066 RepID=UPI000FE5E888|nr:hypothetical protein [Mesorhizobium sp.]RWP98734.1 MAG: hypothetical protein EOR89_18655 [Mesorhizobium sp.]